MSSVKYITSLGTTAQLPTLITRENKIGGSTLPRMAVVGRSNVGKSSLINSLTGNTKIANVSKQPGHTRKINFFEWESRGLVLADLPGYGYAARSESERDDWSAFIAGYLTSDPLLFCAILLVDGRNGPTKLDINALKFLRKHDLPYLIVLTKADALKNQKERSRRTREVKAAFKELGVEQERTFWTSSKEGTDVRPLLIHLSELKDQFMAQKK